MKVLTINCGSSSIKYRLLDTSTDDTVLAGIVERIQDLPEGHAGALRQILTLAKKQTIEAVGHRVVHGGPQFTNATLLDDLVVNGIETCVPLAPLHNPANLAGIQAARTTLPGVPQVAVFDTAFHSQMTGRARYYAIDWKTAEEHRIRRYGFHGTSHACVAKRAANYLQRPLEELRLITCHLGSGASACAIEFGVSVETSMGMTPLEGLVMGTRSGDVDPGVVLKLARELGIDETEELLNHNSGLAGLSGMGSDLRDIEIEAAQGDDRCRQSINVFAHQVRKYIGAYAAVMGGLDAVIMTGGIGENSSAMRQRILQRLDFLGLRLDDDANREASVSEEQPVALISSRHARVHAMIVATNEELEIAHQTAQVVYRQSGGSSPAAIPIAISARHVHLDRETMDKLFGANSQLEVYKAISQPGQFASRQTVTLVGPNGRIDGVRVLGPLRSHNQIEVSRTDEFHLGVDAPIRRSGQVQDSAPITLIGPRGTTHLREGLICARRHIHMTSADAEAYGVKAGDDVEVEINSGPRKLTLGNVLVRVKESYKLEMHIDTDEANAAELSRNATGDLVYTELSRHASVKSGHRIDT